MNSGQCSEHEHEWDVVCCVLFVVMMIVFGVYAEWDSRELNRTAPAGSTYIQHVLFR